MTRFGWIVLAVFALAAAGFALMWGGGPDPAPAPSPVRAQAAPSDALIVPVVGITRQMLTDTWGQSRAGGARAHEAIDIMAPGGRPVLAAAPGVIEKRFTSGDGGLTLYIRSPDRRRSYYYAHLRNYVPDMVEGRQVAAGQPIGFVGDTGNAAAGNTHLHFAIAEMRPDEAWHQGRPVNPYPLLVESAAAR